MYQSQLLARFIKTATRRLAMSCSVIRENTSMVVEIGGEEIYLGASRDNDMSLSRLVGSAGRPKPTGNVGSVSCAEIACIASPTVVMTGKRMRLGFAEYRVARASLSRHSCIGRIAWSPPMDAGCGE